MNSGNAAVRLLAGNFSKHPDKTVYHCGELSITFRELGASARSFAQLLRRNGVTPNDRVVIILPDCLAFPPAFLGCLLAGAMAVPVGSDSAEGDLAHVVRDCEPRLMVVHRGLLSALPASCSSLRTIVCDDCGVMHDPLPSDGLFVPHEPGTGDFAYMLYSSGSTGRPKGIPHRHGSLLLPCELVGRELFGITPSDVIFSTSKLSFAYGLINSISFPLYFGAAAVLLPEKPAPRSILTVISRHSPTLFFSVPTVYAQLIRFCTEQQLNLPLRLCCSAGEMLPAAVFEEWRALTGLEILDGIGCTETAYHFICNVPGRVVSGSAGRLVPGYETRLVDDEGNDVNDGCEGHLLVRGATVTPCYWNLPELSAESITGDGFLRTGDIFVRRNGCYFHQGRSDDMIKSIGDWISPVAVEDALKRHPAVADCAVAPVSVGRFAAPGAFVVLIEGVDPSDALRRELRTHAVNTLPRKMRPVSYFFPGKLPRTATGKIQRYRLRKEGGFRECREDSNDR